MTLDLNEARQLHDRDPDDPGHCLTCRDDTGACVPWPCPTAIALGATGRSEWDDASPNRCGSTGGDPEARCIHTTGHTAMHTNPLGDLW